MDVSKRIRSVWPITLVAGLLLSTGTQAQADPLYTVIDLGTSPLSYGVGSSGNSTVTGSNGLTYIFNPAPNDLPAQWSNTTQGVPNVVAPPIGNGDTYGNPSYAYSQSSLVAMNSQGLAAGLDDWGVAGHIDNSEAFAIQQKANGSWSTPIPLWSGAGDFGRAFGDGILGISPNGQILGYGYNMGQVPSYDALPNGYGLFLYDSKTQSFTNLSTLIDSTMSGSNANWFLNGPLGQIDSQGRILLTSGAYEGYSGQLHSLLLIPEGVSSDPVAAPEPATWAIFATLIGGWIARNRLRPGARGES